MVQSSFRDCPFLTVDVVVAWLYYVIPSAGKIF